MKKAAGVQPRHIVVIASISPIQPIPPIEWPAWTVLIILILAIAATALYVRARTRIGFNDAPPEEIAEEDNTIIEAIRWRNEQEFR